MTLRFRTPAAAALLALLLLVCTVSPLAAAGSSASRWLKIRVFRNDSTTPSVLVNVPMSVVSAFLRIAARTDAHPTIDLPGEADGKTRVHVKDLDLEAVIRELEAMEPGQIVEVQREGERVSIWIE